MLTPRSQFLPHYVYSKNADRSTFQFNIIIIIITIYCKRVFIRKQYSLH
jgi:hypothetical protein